MSLPSRTTILIVGAGPSGLAAAISLVKEGCRDIVVVDAVLQGENTSRAIVIHAATLEALDTVGCTDTLVELGIKAIEMTINDRSRPLITGDFSSLSAYTRYPFALLLPQNKTEAVLGEKLRNLGVNVFRPLKMTAMETNPHDPDTVDVSFETGDVIQANCVIGADGARSMVRQLAGIGFKDPDGEVGSPNPALQHMILADVLFNKPPEPPIPSTRVMGFASLETFFLMAPIPAPWASGSVPEGGRKNIVYRIGCGIPPSLGTPPQSPPTAFLQSLVDSYGPLHLSSDPAVNPHPVHISETVWSTRFRNHAAIADRFFARFRSACEGKLDNPSGGIIVLIGDAAHIHSPAGGQGMNLGIRDAIGLGPVLYAHLNMPTITPPSSGDVDKGLREYAAARHTLALAVIRLTKRLMSLTKIFNSPSDGYLSGSIRAILTWSLVFAGRFRVVKNAAAWRLSGLGAR